MMKDNNDELELTDIAKLELDLKLLLHKFGIEVFDKGQLFMNTPIGQYIISFMTKDGQLHHEGVNGEEWFSITENMLCALHRAVHLLEINFEFLDENLFSFDVRSEDFSEVLSEARYKLRVLSRVVPLEIIGYGADEGF